MAAFRKSETIIYVRYYQAIYLNLQGGATYSPTIATKVKKEKRDYIDTAHGVLDQTSMLSTRNLPLVTNTT